MAVTDYNREKPLSVTSATGTPTVSKAQPLYVTSGDDQTTGTGQVVIDWSNVSSESDMAVYDSADTLLPYEIEDFDAVAETALLWIYNDWVRDGTAQAKLVFGSGPASSEENQAGTWNNTGQNAEAAWHLNESSGDALDSTPNANDGTLNGPTQGATGEFAGGYDFDGTDDEVTVADDTTIDLVSAMTLVVWLNTDVVDSNTSTMLSKYDTDNNERGYQFRISGQNSGDVHFVLATEDGTGFDTTNSTGGAVQADTTHMAVAAWANDQNSGNPQLYLDGSELAYNVQQARTTNVNNNAIDLHIGNSAYTTGRNFDGLLDEIRLYSGKKSPDWIQAEYDASAEGSQTFFDQAGAGDTSGVSPITATASIESAPTQEPAGAASAPATLAATVESTSADEPNGTATLGVPAITATASIESVGTDEPQATVSAPATGQATTESVTTAEPAGSVSAPTAGLASPETLSVEGPLGSASLGGADVIDVVELAGEFVTTAELNGEFAVTKDLSGEFVTTRSLEGNVNDT